MTDGTEKPKIPSKFAKHTAQYGRPRDTRNFAIRKRGASWEACLAVHNNAPSSQNLSLLT